MIGVGDCSIANMSIGYENLEGVTEQDIAEGIQAFLLWLHQRSKEYYRHCVFGVSKPNTTVFPNQTQITKPFHPRINPIYFVSKL